MKKTAPLAAALALGFALGAVVVTPGGARAARVGDAKFENLFVKGFNPTAERPFSLRVAGGAEYVVVALDRVEDDYIVVTLKSKEAAFVRVRDIIAITSPAQ